MLCYVRTGLMEVVVMGPGRAVLFYGRHSLGEGLSLGESRDATFMLTGVGTWLGKPVYLAADPLMIQEGCWEIAQGKTECQIEGRGPGHPLVNLLTPQPFTFDHLGDSSQKDTPGDANSGHQLSPHHLTKGQNGNQCRRDQGQPLPQPPIPQLQV